jgi:hypothetical protein
MRQLFHFFPQYAEGMRYCVIVLALACSAPMWADTRFRISIMPRADLEPGKGQCDIRLEVDEEAQITIRGDQVSVHNVAGQDARDGGSDCNVALPDRDVRNFTLQSVEGRGELRVVEKPSKANDFAVVAHISDRAAGFGVYHFRLTWGAKPDDSANKISSEKQDENRPPVPPGFVWNNAITYRGHGSGESLLGDRSQPLTDARVDIDLGGRIVVSFAPPKTPGVRGKNRPIVFSGTLAAREPSTIRADMITEDRRLRGTMTVAMDDHQNVTAINWNATDGQQHLRLTWAHK